MNRKVTLFVIIGLAVLMALSYALGRYGYHGDPVPPRDYSKEIKVLNDTITELRRI